MDRLDRPEGAVGHLDPGAKGKAKLLGQVPAVRLTIARRLRWNVGIEARWLWWNVDIEARWLRWNVDQVRFRPSIFVPHCSPLMKPDWVSRWRLCTEHESGRDLVLARSPVGWRSGQRRARRDSGCRPRSRRRSPRNPSGRAIYK